MPNTGLQRSLLLWTLAKVPITVDVGNLPWGPTAGTLQASGGEFSSGGVRGEQQHQGSGQLHNSWRSKKLDVVVGSTCSVLGKPVKVASPGKTTTRVF
jgi:hypothetical protein